MISRFSAESGKGDESSEKQVMVIPQPYSNHNGGHLVFGPDGYLYVGIGDGGSANDPQGHGQNRSTLLGTILRIDVSTIDSEGRYAVPPDNPFVGAGGGVREEIWAYGLRNPWRFNFDLATGDLWAADVGQNAWEEVDIIRPGLNYGWNVMEGAHCFAGGRSLSSLLRRGPGECDQDGLELPVVEYDREGGCSITGGYVYRGARLPSLAGGVCLWRLPAAARYGPCGKRAARSPSTGCWSTRTYGSRLSAKGRQGSCTCCRSTRRYTGWPILNECDPVTTKGNERCLFERPTLIPGYRDAAVNVWSGSGFPPSRE